MGRRAAKSSFGRKPGYFEKLAMGTAHDTYDVEKEGLGSEAEWASTFNVRMGFEEAQGYKAASKRKWGSDWTVLAEIAGLHKLNAVYGSTKCGDCGLDDNDPCHKYINENSLWDDIKKAFRKAAMNCHPDRVSQHGKTVEAATAEFKDAQAAFAMLEDIYRSKGRMS